MQRETITDTCVQKQHRVSLEYERRRKTRNSSYLSFKWIVYCDAEKW